MGRGAAKRFSPATFGSGEDAGGLRGSQAKRHKMKMSKRINARVDKTPTTMRKYGGLIGEELYLRYD